MRADQDRAIRRLQQEMARPLGPLEWLLELLAVAGILAAAWFAAANWARLPDRFPVHFDVTGRPDRFGAPGELLVLIGVQVLLYALLTVIIILLPHAPTIRLNVPTATEDDAPRLARVLRWNLRGIKAFLAWLFAYVTWRSILVARGAATGLGEGFVAAVLLLTGAHVIVFLGLLARTGAGSRG